jgi:hypothetical protein
MHEASKGEPVDGAMHRYRLDVSDLMHGLRAILADRGYEIQVDADGGAWIIETRWSRGAACGEIGSVLYALITDTLTEVE